ncbi:hypothetical protein M422DRAFT_54009, partial [Sphaerobolus stellatus SS14]
MNYDRMPVGQINVTVTSTIDKGVFKPLPPLRGSIGQDMYAFDIPGDSRVQPTRQTYPESIRQAAQQEIFRPVNSRSQPNMRQTFQEPVRQMPQQQSQQQESYGPGGSNSQPNSIRQTFQEP